MRSLNAIARAINADLDGLIGPIQSALRATLRTMPLVQDLGAIAHQVEAEDQLRTALEKLTGSRHLPEEKAMVLEARRALLDGEREGE